MRAAYSTGCHNLSNYGTACVLGTFSLYGPVSFATGFYGYKVKNPPIDQFSNSHPLVKHVSVSHGPQLLDPTLLDALPPAPLLPPTNPAGTKNQPTRRKPHPIQLNASKKAKS